MEKENRMRPVIILPKKQMSQPDKKRLRDNGICVVECEDPSLVRFAEPPPGDYSAQERAAIRLARILLSKDNTYMRDRQNIGVVYANLIIEGVGADSGSLRPNDLQSASRVGSDSRAKSRDTTWPTLTPSFPDFCEDGELVPSDLLGATILGAGHLQSEYDSFIIDYLPHEQTSARRLTLLFSEQGMWVGNITHRASNVDGEQESAPEHLS